MLALIGQVAETVETNDQFAQNVVFYMLAAMMVYSALRVVTTKNVVHAAMFLVLVLAGVAAQYLLLAAEFVASAQVLVYIGAVIVLILFGVMLTRAKIGQDTDLTNGYWPIGAVTAVFLFGLLSFTLLDGFGDDTISRASAETQLSSDGTTGVSGIGLNNTEQISDSIFGDYLVAFEAISVLLLGALVGAIVLARKD